MFTSIVASVLFMFSIQTCSAKECTTKYLYDVNDWFDTCFNKTEDLLFYQDDKQPFLQPFLQKVCTTAGQTSLPDCINPLFPILSWCLDRFQRDLLEVFHASVWSGLNYLCNDSALLLTEFRERGRGKECLQAAENGKNKCLRDNPIVSIHILKYDDRFCRPQQATLGCLSQAFQTANCSETASSFLNGYYRAIAQETPCFPKPNKCTCVRACSIIAIILLAFCVAMFSF